MMGEENGLQNLSEHITSKDPCADFSLPGASSSSFLPTRRKRRHGRSSKTQRGDTAQHDKEDGCVIRMDEFDHFGLSIADYIRGIAKLDEKAAVWIRGEIWTLLTKCRMKTLEGCGGNGAG
ncbi:unnamed protein product [Gongylonema pulchrum]|uniref:Uncharacterized protein n=1 Tax=Gongylonema pulchrum TaxID=637853 RepID=A0A183D264_9BILA|nr:unnamed protein product [Gongylonema pulchrum]